jgi:5-hydroxyisourate hydrolase
MTGSDLHAESAVLTTHALDIAQGGPAANLPISLYGSSNGSWVLLKQARTNDQGRCDAPLLTFADVKVGTYRLEFDAKSYHGGAASPFETIPVEFTIADVMGHYHVPLVFAPGGYSTYRGGPPSRTPNDFGSWSVTNNRRDVSYPTTTVPPPKRDGAGLTIHVIDISRGRGATNLYGMLYLGSSLSPGVRVPVETFVVNSEGRTDQWLIEPGKLRAGTYELVFDAGGYFSSVGFGVGPDPFLTRIRIRLCVTDVSRHLHIPLLLAPWGYSCYRGN